MNRIPAYLVALTIVALFGGTPAVQAEANSGFLDNYADLKPDPDRPGVMRYQAPDVKLARYSKIMVAPIELVYDPTSPWKNISPEEMKKLTDAFYKVLVAEFEPAYPIVAEPGPGVLAVRLAITGIRMENKKRSLLSYTPAGFAATTLANAAGLRITLKSAGLEAELLDSVSGALLGSLVDKGAAASRQGDSASWEDLNNTLQFYAQRFHKRLDADRAP